MTGDRALELLREAHQREKNGKAVWGELVSDGITAQQAVAFLRALREQRWRKCADSCEESLAPEERSTHVHRTDDRAVDIGDGHSVWWEAQECFNDEQSRHSCPGSRRTLPGSPQLRAMPSDARERIEAAPIMQSVDDLGIVPVGIGRSHARALGSGDNVAA